MSEGVVGTIYWRDLHPSINPSTLIVDRKFVYGIKFLWSRMPSGKSITDGYPSVIFVTDEKGPTVSLASFAVGNNLMPTWFFSSVNAYFFVVYTAKFDCFFHMKCMWSWCEMEWDAKLPLKIPLATCVVHVKETIGFRHVTNKLILSIKHKMFLIEI